MNRLLRLGLAACIAGMVMLAVTYLLEGVIYFSMLVGIPAGMLAGGIAYLFLAK